MPKERVLRYQKLEGGEAEYTLGRFDTVLHVRCPIDRTPLVQTQEEGIVNFCPSCGTKYDSLKPEDIAKQAKASIASAPARIRKLREEESRLIALSQRRMD
ncbi:hypothetical protein FJZ17_02695 [Candidatus Pacearchaeota archaeon]|nr:hypothetical protein [Candidatus Pacearchaeota archaeon]